MNLRPPGPRHLGSSIFLKQIDMQIYSAQHASMLAQSRKFTRQKTVSATSWLAAAVLASAALSGCGGGGNAADTALIANASLITGASPPGGSASSPSLAATSTNVRVSGRVMNVGYLGNTQICADLNGDGECSASEPSSVSNASGNYAFDVPVGYRGVALLAVVRPDTIDSAATAIAPVPIHKGWTLTALLEYEDGARTAALNISPISSTYYARMRLGGRNRLNNQTAMFTRIVYDTNIDAVTGRPLLSHDFDYVANVKPNLAPRIQALTAVLSARAQAANAPLPMLLTTAVMNAWYNTYVGPTATVAALPVDASKIAAFADTSTSSVAYYLANDYRYFRINSDAAGGMRAGLADTAGWYRSAGAGQLDVFDRRALTLANGGALYQLARYTPSQTGWAPLSVDEGGYFTHNPQGRLVWNSGTDYLLPRTIVATDGNSATLQSANSGVRTRFEVADSPGTNFFIEEWVGQQNGYANYYNGVLPTVDSVTSKPACSVTYPGSPQPDAATGTTVSGWFGTCFNYYTAEYYDKVLGDLNLQLSVSTLPGANFYDATALDAQLVVPAKQSCGTDSAPIARVTTQGQSHCNWAVDANAGHSMADLFSAQGVVLPSWTKVYGPTSFTTAGVTTVRVAGMAGEAGLPQRLTLKLVRTGNELQGSGTLTSPFGAWTATSFTATTEAISWRIDPQQPNMVLLSWPFRDVNDPRVKTNTAANGAAAVPAPLLPGGHFTAVFNGNNFSVAPATLTAPNYRALAVVLQDGVFMTGQYYGAGYTYSERYFTLPAMERGITALNYVFGKLYQIGFTDRRP